ncbi:MAG: porin family protein [Treponema sp.]|nr:porin family protein [Treponema sp.]
MRKIVFSVLIFTFLICPSVMSQKRERREGGKPPSFAVISQRDAIKKRDAEGERQENVIMQTRTDSQNNLIQINKKIVNEKSENVLNSIPDQTEEALQAVRKLEKLKTNILRFGQYYDVLSPEIQSLTEELEEEYAALAQKTFTTTSLSPHVTLRCDSYNEASDSWRALVYSDFFNDVKLFNGTVELPYKEFFGKRNPFSGYRKAGKEEMRANNIMIADSLFRTAQPAVYAVVSYRIVRWKEASEYRFVPVRCEIYRTDNNTFIAKFGKDDLAQTSFIMLPQVEVRTAAQKEKEEQLTGKQLAKQDAKIASKVEDSYIEKSRFPLFDRQFKRRAIFVTVDTRLFPEDFSPFDLKLVKLNSIKLNMDFGLTNHIFVGGSMEYDYNGPHKNADYGFGLNLGFNVTLFNFIRPYIQTGLSFITDYSLVTTFGGGVDIFFGKFMMNLGYGYNWDYDINSKFKLKKERDRDNLLQYHTFSVGAGFTW